MIILDTNVVSALMQDPTEPAVLDWLNRQAWSSIWTTSLTLFEVRFGIEKLSAGRRRDALLTALDQLVRDILERRILVFDEPAAIETALLAARRRTAGRPIGLVDEMIAGIARARRGTFATRNIKHFADAGIDLVDPWASSLL